MEGMNVEMNANSYFLGQDGGGREGGGLGRSEGENGSPDIDSLGSMREWEGVKEGMSGKMNAIYYFFGWHGRVETEVKKRETEE